MLDSGDPAFDENGKYDSTLIERKAWAVYASQLHNVRSIFSGAWSTTWRCVIPRWILDFGNLLFFAMC